MLSRPILVLAVRQALAGPRKHATLLALACALLARSARAQAPLNIVHPLPPQSPAWLDGHQIRWAVRVAGEPSQQTAQSVVVSLPTGGWLKPDASDLAVQGADGKPLPAVVLSHDPEGETLVQFKRRADDAWYWVYGVGGPPGPKADPKADPAFREGISLEVREWAGGELDGWAKVRAGLEKSTKVVGNAVVAEVMQSGNPARPDQPASLAASYRGYLNVKKDGTYRFFVNADDATFLFVDGFKVFERAGAGNRLLSTVKVSELEKLAGKVDLKAGVHAFEVHNVTGSAPDVSGRCALVWITPENPKVAMVHPNAVAHPLYARAAAAEARAGEPPAYFAHGIEDTIEGQGLKLFLVRFEAQGPHDGAALRWDFGDGTTGTGRSVVHVYFTEGDYPVTLKAGAGPAYRRRVRVWPEAGETGPLSLGLAVKTLGQMEWQKLDPARQREIFAFLQVCEQPERWPMLDEVAQHLLARAGLDLETKSQLYVARLEALTNTGRATDALKLAEKVAPEFAKAPALEVRLRLAVAAIHQYHHRDPAAASKIYKAVLDEHSRTEHPNLRLAGVRWGDLFAEAGDLVRAAETYRVAATLGGEKFTATTADASTRGALLRIAEQKLRAGEVQATRQLLQRLEMDYPGRRLDGLYCFLRAESDRFSGRYEDALRHYEMVFKLPQWAGYRDRATFGIADTYRRLGELDKALKWLGELKDEFPKFYEAQKGPELHNLLTRRQQRLQEAKAKGEAPAAAADRFHTGLEPDEPDWFGELKDGATTREAAVVRAPGMRGPHAGLLDAYPRELANFEFNRPLRDLNPGGTYWVEVWYRDVVRPAPPLPHQTPSVQAVLIGETAPKTSELAGFAVPRGPHHQWHRAGVKIKAPFDHEFTFRIAFTNFTGAHLIDRISIRPVSDRQLDALAAFQEGKAP